MFLDLYLLVLIEQCICASVAIISLIDWFLFFFIFFLIFFSVFKIDFMVTIVLKLKSDSKICKINV